MTTLTRTFAYAAALLFSAPALAIDEAEVQTLLRDSRCTKCHDVEKQKAGPPFAKVAAKYKGDSSAVAKLTKHVTEPSEVEIDGEKEQHGMVKTRDADRVANLVSWILSR